MGGIDEWMAATPVNPQRFLQQRVTGTPLDPGAASSATSTPHGARIAKPVVSPLTRTRQRPKPSLSPMRKRPRSQASQSSVAAGQAEDGTTPQAPHPPRDGSCALTTAESSVSSRGLCMDGMVLELIDAPALHEHHPSTLPAQGHSSLSPSEFAVELQSPGACSPHPEESPRARSQPPATSDTGTAPMSIGTEGSPEVGFEPGPSTAAETPPLQPQAEAFAYAATAERETSSPASTRSAVAAVDALARAGATPDTSGPQRGAAAPTEGSGSSRATVHADGGTLDDAPGAPASGGSADATETRITADVSFQQSAPGHIDTPKIATEDAQDERRELIPMAEEHIAQMPSEPPAAANRVSADGGTPTLHFRTSPTGGAAAAAEPGVGVVHGEEGGGGLTVATACAADQGRAVTNIGVASAAPEPHDGGMRPVAAALDDALIVEHDLVGAPVPPSGEPCSPPPSPPAEASPTGSSPPLPLSLPITPRSPPLPSPYCTQAQAPPPHEHLVEEPRQPSSLLPSPAASPLADPDVPATPPRSPSTPLSDPPSTPPSIPPSPTASLRELRATSLSPEMAPPSPPQVCATPEMPTAGSARRTASDLGRDRDSANGSAPTAFDEVVDAVEASSAQPDPEVASQPSQRGSLEDASAAESRASDAPGEEPVTIAAQEGVYSSESPSNVGAEAQTNSAGGGIVPEEITPHEAPTQASDPTSQAGGHAAVRRRSSAIEVLAEVVGSPRALGRVTAAMQPLEPTPSQSTDGTVPCDDTRSPAREPCPDEDMTPLSKPCPDEDMTPLSKPCPDEDMTPLSKPCPDEDMTPLSKPCPDEDMTPLSKPCPDEDMTPLSKPCPDEDMTPLSKPCPDEDMTPLSKPNVVLHVDGEGESDSDLEMLMRQEKRRRRSTLMSNPLSSQSSWRGRGELVGPRPSSLPQRLHRAPNISRTLPKPLQHLREADGKVYVAEFPMPKARILALTIPPFVIIVVAVLVLSEFTLHALFAVPCLLALWAAMLGRYAYGWLIIFDDDATVVHVQRQHILPCLRQSEAVDYDDLAITSEKDVDALYHLRLMWPAVQHLPDHFPPGFLVCVTPSSHVRLWWQKFLESRKRKIDASLRSPRKHPQNVSNRRGTFPQEPLLETDT